MTRALVIIRSAVDRARLVKWVQSVPFGTRVEFKAPRRSLEQNSLLWARLTEISMRVDWYGERLSSEDWKTMFSAALRKSRVVPGIDGGFVVLGLSTSQMTKGEMGDLLTLIEAFASERGIVFFDQETQE